MTTNTGTKIRTRESSIRSCRRLTFRCSRRSRCPYTFRRWACCTRSIFRKVREIVGVTVASGEKAESQSGNKYDQCCRKEPLFHNYLRCAFARCHLYDSTSSRACQHRTDLPFSPLVRFLFLSTARKFARCLCFLPIFTDKGRAATRPCCFAHSLFLAQFFTQPFRLLCKLFRVFFVARLYVYFHQKLTNLCCFLFFSILLI